jgi:hypothetical protein
VPSHSASLGASRSASRSATLMASRSAQLALGISSSAWTIGRREKIWTCERARGVTNTMRPSSNYYTSMGALSRTSLMPLDASDASE